MGISALTLSAQTTATAISDARAPRSCADPYAQAQPLLTRRGASQSSVKPKNQPPALRFSPFPHPCAPQWIDSRRQIPTGAGQDVFSPGSGTVAGRASWRACASPVSVRTGRTPCSAQSSPPAPGDQQGPDSACPSNLLGVILQEAACWGRDPAGEGGEGSSAENGLAVGNLRLHPLPGVCVLSTCELSQDFGLKLGSQDMWACRSTTLHALV